MSTSRTCREQFETAKANAEAWEKGSCYGHAWWTKAAEVHHASPFYRLRAFCCGEDFETSPEDTTGTKVEFNFRPRNETVHLGEPEEHPFVQEYLRRLHKSQDDCQEVPVCSQHPTMLDFIALTSLFVVVSLCCFLRIRRLRPDPLHDHRDLVDLDAEAASRGMSAELALVSRASAHGVEKAQQQLQFIRSMDGLNVSDNSTYQLHGDMSGMSAETVGSAPMPSNWTMGGVWANSVQESSAAPQESSPPAQTSSAALESSTAAHEEAKFVESKDTAEVEKTLTKSVEEKTDEEVAVRKGTIHEATLQEEVVEWLQILSGEKLGVTDPSTDDIAAWLKDGRILCLTVNAIKPGTIKTINKGQMVFKQRENINYFNSACRDLGVTDTFPVNDLFEAKNMENVFTCIHALGGVSRTVAGFHGPFIGLKSNAVIGHTGFVDLRKKSAAMERPNL
eukprot:TRINITY_DN7305_c0_g1_i7.p1 TRINITY_DN7305_c0_g1~~TRINITY_DN7305_c0_g1_i7.p1  ORF type:complete len:450 (-),score=65.66 TRINITY_DN7305_c0_g1_i7:45-1394(-)